MQRWTSVVVGFVAAGALVGLAFLAGRPTARGAKPMGSASASASSTPLAPPESSGEAPGEPSLATEPAAEPIDADSGSRLPSSAPATVSFGVILFTYQGAQLAPAGARPKEQALALARGIVEEAKKDFAEAAKKGDRGSTADAGRIPRGVLEPEIEYVLFTLEKGGVHAEPLDTPRGYWVVRRGD